MPKVNWRVSGWRGGIFLLVAALIVITDQLSKDWIRAHLKLNQSLPEVGVIRLTHVQNTGSAFGLFANQALLLTLTAIVGLVVILMFYRYLSQFSIWGTLSLGLVFGGAIGNLIDRFQFGYVTDFIDVRLWDDFHWPTFNIADSAITVGVIVLAYFIFVMLKKEHGQSAKART